LKRHIDSTGTERAILSSVWTHSEHKKPGVKKLVAALNSIKYYAEHAENDKRFIALSDNGIVIIFEYSEKYNGVYTFFDFANRKKAEKYFKKYHKQETREVIKRDDGWISRWVNGLMSKWESV